MNWHQYNTNLIKRGNIDLWISEDIVEWWYSLDSKRRGHPLVYSDRAIETCLTFKSLFGMPLRMTEGFLQSLFQRADIFLQVPSYTQMNRRMTDIKLPQMKIQNGLQVTLALDSTGLKVYGEGEWKVRTHGISKRRIWRKLHLAVDVKTLNITHSMLTTCSTTDADAAEQMLADEAPEAIKAILGDGAYDKAKVYRMARKMNAQAIIPPAHNARIQTTIIDPAKITRDDAIAKIKMFGGDGEARKQWKEKSGYHQRSLAETSVYRFKTAFTHRLRHRLFPNQAVEAAIKINILNNFTAIGIPRTA